MGWKGTIRSMEAAANRAARNADRRRKHNAKMQIVANAQASVIAFEEYLERITGLHKSAVSQSKFDWISADTRLPKEPINYKRNEEIVRREIDNFKPNFFHRIFGKERKLYKLNDKLNKARAEDTKIFKQLVSKYQEQYKMWEIGKLATSENPQDKSMAYCKILEGSAKFANIEDLGNSISIVLDDGNNFIVTVSVHGEDVVPDEKLSLRQSGTLSTRKMPRGEFYELYQDYVCSCVLRIAIEIFALIPIEKVLINANDKLLNPKTGHLEDQTLLSVLVVRETIDQLNIQKIDPSDAMRNFVHNMQFTRTKGFSPVERLAPDLSN